MWNRLRPRSVYDVMAAIACFGVLAGGTAYAANTIGSADVIDDSLQSVDVKNGSLTSSDLARETLSSGRIFGLDGTDVDDDGLTGADIDEPTLGTVPQAAKVGAGGVDSAALQSGSVTNDKLAPEEGWHYIGDPGEPAFENGWVNYDPASNHYAGYWHHAAYRRDRSGMVHLTGLVKGGTVGQPIFHIRDVKYCPYFYHTVAGVSANAFAQLTVGLYTIDAGCKVLIERGSSAWASLDGLSYPEYFKDSAKAPGPAAR
ncbi:MAG TPA: hypothetical protein VF533_04430 [Solirubrobacteraceae bacterium]|jgi:hypothetical protein